MEPDEAVPDACRRHRESVTRSGGALPGEPHGESCEECRRFARLAQARTHLLGGLPRRSVPAGLESLVRAELSRRPVERLLTGLPRAAAPAVLERLVSEELASPTAALSRRALHGLPRFRAPATGIALRRAGPGVRHALRRMAATGGLLAAAALLAWFGGPILGDGGASDGERAVVRAGERSVPRFRLVVVNSVDQLDPMARGLAEGLAGRPLTASPR